MLSINPTSFTSFVLRQRRFQMLLVILIGMSLALGLLVVPIEARYPSAKILTWFDGIWWSVITITGVGYGDMYPVSHTGRIIGMMLAVMGVLGYGLIISMFSSALEETKDRYYRGKVFERLDDVEDKLDQLSRRQNFVVQKEINKK